MSAKVLRLCALWFLSASSSLVQAAPDGGSDAQLAARADLAQLETLALSRHPLLAQQQARSDAASAAQDAQGALAPPELVYQQWAVPLQRPYDLSRASMLMLGARVKIPSAGARSGQRAAARERVAVERALSQQAERIVRYELRRAYVSYAAAYQELRLHDAHQQLTQQLLDLLRVSYESARSRQLELHAARAALAELHRDSLEVQARLSRARARLNVLAGRGPDAALGPPDALQLRKPSAHELQTQLAGRPELTAMRHARSEREQLLRANERDLRRPEWTVGVDYMAMPEVEAYARYGAMVSMTMPWFSPSLRAERRKLQSELMAEQHGVALEQQRGQLLLSDLWHELEAKELSRTVLAEQTLVHLSRAHEAVQSDVAAGRAQASELLERADALLAARLNLVRLDEERDALVLELERLLDMDLRQQGGQP